MCFEILFLVLMCNQSIDLLSSVICIFVLIYSLFILFIFVVVFVVDENSSVVGAMYLLIEVKNPSCMPVHADAVSMCPPYILL